jgi:hypothetical protein
VAPKRLPAADPRSARSPRGLPRASESGRSDATAAGADAEHATARLHGNEADPAGSEPERDPGELRWSCVAVAPIADERIVGNEQRVLRSSKECFSRPLQFWSTEPQSPEAPSP